MDLFSQHQEHYDTTFEALDLKSRVIEAKRFDHCLFTACHFTEAHFIHCRFIDCRFVSCDLSNLKLGGSSFRSVIFENSKLLGMNFTQAASLIPFHAVGCMLDYASFAGLTLKKARFERCSVREVDFAEADLSEGFFGAANLAGSRFLNTNLTKADFRGAVNYTIGPRDNILKKARFSLPEALSLLYGLGIVIEDE
jgi:uncharacterized protein YjbI with pentapeptide repeats